MTILKSKKLKLKNGSLPVLYGFLSWKPTTLFLHIINTKSPFENVIKIKTQAKPTIPYPRELERIINKLETTTPTV